MRGVYHDPVAHAVLVEDDRSRRLDIILGEPETAALDRFSVKSPLLVLDGESPGNGRLPQVPLGIPVVLHADDQAHCS